MYIHTNAALNAAARALMCTAAARLSKRQPTPPAQSASPPRAATTPRCAMNKRGAFRTRARSSMCGACVWGRRPQQPEAPALYLPARAGRLLDVSRCRARQLPQLASIQTGLVQSAGSAALSYTAAVGYQRLGTPHHDFHRWLAFRRAALGLSSSVHALCNRLPLPGDRLRSDRYCGGDGRMRPWRCAPPRPKPAPLLQQVQRADSSRWCCGADGGAWWDGHSRCRPVCAEPDRAIRCSTA
jgi:hypothetical protein